MAPPISACWVTGADYQLQASQVTPLLPWDGIVGGKFGSESAENLTLTEYVIRKLIGKKAARIVAAGQWPKERDTASRSCRKQIE